MAKLTDDQKSDLLADWATGRYSQRDLVEKYGASKGTVGKLTKGVEQKNGHLVDAQISLLTAKALLSKEEMGAIVGAAQDEVFAKGLVTNATQMNLVRITQHLAGNQKLEKINIGDGMQNFEPVGLGAGDYKSAQEAIHKAGQSLGVVEQFAPKTEITNTNATQNNTKRVTIARRSDRRDD